ncbi:MAG: choice-of-anchor B family protein, partial [Flavobacteriales bacterium]
SSTPVLLGSLTSYPDAGYNHSGWLSEDGKTYAMGDETHGKKLKIIDVSDVSNMTFLDTVGLNSSRAIIHNQIIKGDLVYVAYYYDGVYIYDIKNPSSPKLTGFFDTSTEINGRSFRGCWGIYPFLPSGVLLASDMQEGLFVLDVSKASKIEEIADKSRFSLFPNPATNEFFLMGLSKYNEQYKMEIIDINGKKVLSNVFQNNFLDKVQVSLPSELPSGVYVVNIFNSTFAQSIKLIKQ